MAAKVEKKSKKKSSKKLMLLEKKKAMEEAAKVAAEAAKVAAKEAAAAARAVEKELNDDTSSNSSEVVDQNPSISSKIEKVSNSFVKGKKNKESKKRDKNSLMKEVNVKGDEKENNVVNGSSDSSSDSNSDDSKSSNSNSDGSSDSNSDSNSDGSSDSDSNSDGSSDSNSDGSSDSNSDSNIDGSSDNNSDGSSDNNSDGSSDSSSDDSSDSNNANSSAVYHGETESKNIKMRNTAPESLVEKQRKVSSSSGSSSDNANSSGISDGEKENKDIKVQNVVPENIVEKQRKISDDSNRKNANLDNYQQKNEGISKKRQINLDTEENAQIKKKVAIENDETNLKIYVRGLPWKANEDEVREYFSTCGEIISIEMPIMDDGRSSGTAIINFKTKQACETCLELNGSDFNGRWLNIKYSTPKPIWSPREPSQKVDGCTTVFVGNLSFQIDENTLREAFGECGEITQVRFAEDRETGQFKGFGHIEFAKTESTNLAVKMTGTNIMGRPVRVDFANPRKNTFAGGRGRGPGKKGGRGHDGGRGRSSMRGGGLMPSKKKSGIMQFSGSKTTFD